jgi:hypothetical protein
VHFSALDTIARLQPGSAQPQGFSINFDHLDHPLQIKMTVTPQQQQAILQFLGRLGRQLTQAQPLDRDQALFQLNRVIASLNAAAARQAPAATSEQGIIPLFLLIPPICRHQSCCRDCIIIHLSSNDPACSAWYSIQLHTYT